MLLCPRADSRASPAEAEARAFFADEDFNGTLRLVRRRVHGTRFRLIVLLSALEGHVVAALDIMPETMMRERIVLHQMKR